MRRTCEEWFAQLRDSVATGEAGRDGGDAASAASAPAPLRPPGGDFRPMERVRPDPEKKDALRAPVLADHGKARGKT